MRGGRPTPAAVVLGDPCIIARRDLAPLRIVNAAMRQSHFQSMAASREGYLGRRARQAHCPLETRVLVDYF